MKTKVLTSFAVTAKLICMFVFAYADCWFSHVAAHIFYWGVNTRKQTNIQIVNCLLGSGGLVVERRTPNREVLGSNPHKGHCVVSLSKIH